MKNNSYLSLFLAVGALFVLAMVFIRSSIIRENIINTATVLSSTQKSQYTVPIKHGKTTSQQTLTVTAPQVSVVHNYTYEDVGAVDGSYYSIREFTNTGTSNAYIPANFITYHYSLAYDGCTVEASWPGILDYSCDKNPPQRSLSPYPSEAGLSQRGGGSTSWNSLYIDPNDDSCSVDLESSETVQRESRHKLFLIGGDPRQKYAITIPVHANIIAPLQVPTAGFGCSPTYTNGWGNGGAILCRSISIGGSSVDRVGIGNTCRKTLFLYGGSSLDITPTANASYYDYDVGEAYPTSMIPVTEVNPTVTSVDIGPSGVSTSKMVAALAQAVGSPFGFTMTVRGSGFDLTDNSIRLSSISSTSADGDMVVIDGVSSSAGVLQAQVPPDIIGGIYSVSVRKQASEYSNTVDVFIPSITNPFISSISPTSGPANITINVMGNNFVPGYTFVHFNQVNGDTYQIYRVNVISPTQLTFISPVIIPGTYRVSVEVVKDLTLNGSNTQSVSNEVNYDLTVPVTYQVQTSFLASIINAVGARFNYNGH